MPANTNRSTNYPSQAWAIPIWDLACARAGKERYPEGDIPFTIRHMDDFR